MKLNGSRIGALAELGRAEVKVHRRPTVAVFRDGEPVSGFVGAHPASAIGTFLDDVIATHAEAVETA